MSDEIVIKKKRERKTKKENKEESLCPPIESCLFAIEQPEQKEEAQKDQEQSEKEQKEEPIVFTMQTSDDEVTTKTAAKKRGRKPKGGKIVQQGVPSILNIENKTNVIMHLKCSMKDLQGCGVLNTTIENYNFSSNKNELSYEIMGNNNQIINQSTVFQSNANQSVIEQSCENEQINSFDQKDTWRKLKQLEHNLHKNNIGDKKSACFWCTCDFDNPPVYIPKHYIKDSYHVYGCFCSPECATAHLMEEHIDSSAKFERYHLINHIYSKIYDYKKNIKPAPNPYYLLDKFYGNLNIQEYRALLRNERLFLVVDKPLTRVLPELHEDNDDFIINNKVIPSNTYQVKKVQRKQQTKTTIMNENFGLSST